MKERLNKLFLIKKEWVFEDLEPYLKDLQNYEKNLKKLSNCKIINNLKIYSLKN
jgi:hypothetical protein